MSVMGSTSALHLDGISKAFEGAPALIDVSLEIMPGEVHALLGENGAGKSTLMSVAAGDLRPDSGSIEIGGVALEAAAPTVANKLGLAVVYQHPSVLADLTVWENMALAMPSERRPRPSVAPLWAKQQLADLSSAIDPMKLGADLSLVEREMVEIAKALALEPRVLLLDEPTAVLRSDQVELLFERIREIKERGTAIVYISHRIPEIRRVADRVTVLRDGRTRGTFRISEVDDAEIVRLITGREISAIYPHKASELGETLLECQNLSGEGLEEVSLTVRAGEILGLGGASGNGQTEVIRAMAGLHRFGGSISVEGRKVPGSRSSEFRKAGILYVPGDRENEGIFPMLSIRKNAAAQTLSQFSRAGIMRTDTESSAVSEVLTRLAVKTPSRTAEIQKLSGGNQQKVVFARSLLDQPRVLLCDEPTQGVDVQTRTEIHQTLRSLADQGSAVVVLSSDSAELAGLCDRVAIFSRGHVIAELEGDEVTDSSIVAAALTSTQTRQVTGELGGSVSLGRRLMNLARGNLAAPLTLLVVTVLFGAYTGSVSSTYLGAYNLSGELFLAAALVLVSLGQLVVMLTGGIDLSVGPLMAVSVVTLSFFEQSGQSLGVHFFGVLIVVAVGGATGVGHGLMIRRLRLPPIIVTVITYIGFQGVALLLRSGPAGSLDPGISSAVQSAAGPVSLVFVIAILLTALMQFVLRRTHFGLALRGVGSSEQSAHRVGVDIDRTIIAAYVLCSLFTVVAGMLLYVQVGIGDPTVGISYSLQSIAAVVLGGASIYGGRGSFVGAAVGGLLLSEIIGALPFLNLSEAWQYWFPGILILVAGVFFARTFRAADNR